VYYLERNTDFGGGYTLDDVTALVLSRTEDANLNNFFTRLKTELLPENKGSMKDGINILMRSDSGDEMIDYNNNGKWDAVWEDIYRNGRYDETCPVDFNGNGYVYDDANKTGDLYDYNEFMDYYNGTKTLEWDLQNGSDHFIRCDLDGDGTVKDDEDDRNIFNLIYTGRISDDGEALLYPETYVDQNRNGRYDIGEVFVDSLRSDNSWNNEEWYVDENNDGRFNAGEELTTDGYLNGRPDGAEAVSDSYITGYKFDSGRNRWFDDTNNNGKWDDAEAVLYKNDGDLIFDYAAYNEGGVGFIERWFVDANHNGKYDDDNAGERNSVVSMSKDAKYDPINGVWFLDTRRWGCNGAWDDEEFYVDANGNKRFDAGDKFTDVDGNGIWDPQEEFADLNGNGVWDDGERYFDDTGHGGDGDGLYDGPEIFYDENDNNIYDPAEWFEDTERYNGLWDDSESKIVEGSIEGDKTAQKETGTGANAGKWYIDRDNSGSFTEGEDLVTEGTMNAVFDPDQGWYVDRNNSGEWDGAEPLWNDKNHDGDQDDGEESFDTNNNGVWDAGDSFVDLDDDGVWDADEPYTDANGNKRYDPADRFTDSERKNGKRDATESFNDGYIGGVFHRELVNDKYDGPEGFADTDRDGVWDAGEELLIFIKGNIKYDAAHDGWYDDINGAGWDGENILIYGHNDACYDNASGELFIDTDGDLHYDQRESLNDRNGDGVWTDGEDFTDSGYNGIWDDAEKLTVDVDHDGIYDPDDGDIFTAADDTNHNGVWDDKEDLTYDSNGDGKWDPGEEFTDLNGDGLLLKGYARHLLFSGRLLLK